jgi:hypothetical protein
MIRRNSMTEITVSEMNNFDMRIRITYARNWSIPVELNHSIAENVEFQSIFCREK